MEQESYKNIESNAFERALKVDILRTRAYIKQETEESTVVYVTLPFVVTRTSFLDHELHSHKTKEIPIIDLKTLCCNICNRSYAAAYAYRKHMAVLNNIHVPLIRPRSKEDLSKRPDINDPNNYCVSCNHTHTSRHNYHDHLFRVHHMLRFKRPSETFLSKINYIHHLVRLHGITFPASYSEISNFDKENLYCKTCDKSTELPSRPVLMPNINDQNNYCAACDKTFPSKNSYRQHLTVVHVEEKPELYQGIDCKVPSSEGLRLERYCADCRKVFLAKRFHQIHMNKIHGIEPLKRLPNADDPDKISQHSYLSTPFSLIHKLLLPRKNILINVVEPVVDLVNNYCNVCDKTYEMLTYYRIHMPKRHHIKISRIKPRLSYINRNETPVIDGIDINCIACSKVYSDRGSYRRHLYVIHNILLLHPRHKRRFNNDDTIPDMNDKINHCASCNVTYSNRTVYTHHLNEIHSMKTEEIKLEDTEKTLYI
ncbi:hypothetical protein BDF21DRAFT_477400 [Thamnidium elegans]|nr:hypothetical protein BDF21DRAFT_477400 [Thamnidium elegans]